METDEERPRKRGNPRETERETSRNERGGGDGENCGGRTKKRCINVEKERADEKGYQSLFPSSRSPPLSPSLPTLSSLPALSSLPSSSLVPPSAASSSSSFDHILRKTEMTLFSKLDEYVDQLLKAKNHADVLHCTPVVSSLLTAVKLFKQLQKQYQ